MQIVASRDREIAELEREVGKLKHELQHGSKLLLEARVAVTRAETDLKEARDAWSSEQAAVKAQLSALASQMQRERIEASETENALTTKHRAEARALRVRIADVRWRWKSRLLPLPDVHHKCLRTEHLLPEAEPLCDAPCS